MTLLIGADPELFVQKKGHFISGHIFKCGTKVKPKKTKHGAVQNDGLALEFNIPPAATEQAFIGNIRSMMADVSSIVKKRDRSCSLIASPVAPFAKDYLATLPRHVRELGCNPDYNAYSLESNPAPDGDKEFRTGAGHIHLGWGDGMDQYSADHFMKCASLVRELDYFVGLPMLKIDPDDQRRNLYGKAGAFRPKSYGVEYRVPSNVWLQREEWWKIVYNQTVKAYNRWAEGTGIVGKYRGLARDLINSNTVCWDEQQPDLAQEIYQ